LHNKVKQGGRRLISSISYLFKSTPLRGSQGLRNTVIPFGVSKSFSYSRANSSRSAVGFYHKPLERYSFFPSVKLLNNCLNRLLLYNQVILCIISFSNRITYLRQVRGCLYKASYSFLKQVLKHIYNRRK